MREIHTRTYVIAGIITSVIFILGLLVGLVIEGKRVAVVSSEIKEQSLDFSSLQLQFEIVDQLSKEKNCPAIAKTFNHNLETLEKTRIRLENFDQQAALDKAEFEVLKREYVHAQVRYWLLAKRNRDICGEDLVTVLYFFTEKEQCPDCDPQSFVLTYFKKLFGDKLLNFAFDVRIQEPILEILRDTYNVTDLPSLVVNDKTLSGFHDKDDLLKELCSQFKVPPPECQTT